jgi:hypothetical protein
MQHLSESDIVRFVAKKIRRAEREGMVRHLADCPPCTELLAATAKFRSAEDPGSIPHLDAEIFERAATAPWARTSMLRRIFRWDVRPALAGLAIMVLSALILGDRSEPLEQFRSEGDTAPPMTLLPSDGSVLEENPEFRWTPVEEADGYRFVLFSSNGVEYWNRTLSDTAISPAGSANLRPGDYFWRVEAIMPDTRVVKSELHTFRYAPGPPR